MVTDHQASWLAIQSTLPVPERFLRTDSRLIGGSALLKGEIKMRRSRFPMFAMTALAAVALLVPAVAMASLEGGDGDKFGPSAIGAEVIPASITFPLVLVRSFLMVLRFVF